MVFFKRKKKDVIDLGEHYRRKQERIKNLKESQIDSKSDDEPATPFAFFAKDSETSHDSMNSESDSQDTDVLDLTHGVEEKRKKLAKRILDMTNKMEDLSNQIYHLQQRIEVLERKTNVNSFD